MLRPVELRVPTFLVHGRWLVESIRKCRDERPEFPSGFDQIVADLARLPSGVPAVLTERADGGHGLQLHTYTYVLRLSTTKDGDGYWVNSMHPLRLPDHDRLARGCLLLRAAWRPVLEPHQIPNGVSAGWPDLLRAWQQLQAQLGNDGGVPALSQAHTQFLNTLDRLNEAEQRLRIEHAEDVPTFPYASIAPTSERRDSSAGRYVFHVVGGVLPERNAYVQVRGRLGQRGQVTRVTGARVTVRFDEDVDFAALPAQGELLLGSTEISYRKRRETIGQLRARQTRNPALLDVLVERRVQPIDAVRAEPGDELDPDQLAAFRKALGVRDLMVVLGPPGTGKTRTISQIARAHALGGNQDSVLIASHTNKAVDNVLAKLPRDVSVVRVGNEGKIDPDVLPFLLEPLAKGTSQEAAKSAGAKLGYYAGVPHALRWHVELGERLTAFGATIADEARWHQQWRDRVRAVAGPAASHLDRCLHRTAKLDDRMARTQAKVNRLGTARFLREWRLARATAKLAALVTDAGAARTELAAAEQAVEAATRDVPQVREARDQWAELTRQCGQLRAEAFDAVTNTIAPLGPLPTVAPVPDTGDNATVLAALREFERAMGDQLALLLARETLLREWQRDVSSSIEQLYPELIRYADVVGATCIGSASRPEIAQEQFDLAIIDEAGQIATADVLIPLVRARRAVLVGDHRQLPPIVAKELIDEETDPAARDLLERSALENLVNGGFPDSHRQMLTEQRRMPKVIADFVSEAFYDSRLRTIVTRTHDDAIFDSALAFVTTADLPPDKRRETFVNVGYVNETEARMLARLAVHYQRNGREWALIVPYRAQLARITELVLATIPDQEVVKANIGTVDAFQGGERDVILYGFTRSNARCQVGFLNELRRANVAFTRAKRQLVLVGDLDVLVRASDPGFRELMVKLRAHVAGSGDLQPSTAVWHRLQALEERA